MRASTLVGVFALVIAAVSASPIDGDGGVCATAGRICGKVPCVPQNGGSYFTCDCGPDHYFNATAQRCYHVGNCISEPCPSGVCRDNDGRSARTCDCSNIKHLTPDCKLEPAFNEACSKYHGGVHQNERGEIECSCPFGMKFNGEDCESFACAVTGFSCQQICDYKPYREDKRCCQGWDDSCGAFYEESTYCKPGTMPAGKNHNNLNCTNVCAMGASPCEYDCTYEDPKSRHYTCKCPDGQELTADTYTCKDKTECTDEEEVKCTRKNQRCVVEERRAVCKCFADQILINGGCQRSCTDSKTSTCATTLSRCEIVDNVETCVCDKPLTWNEAEKKCVLEKQFLYDVQFEMNQYLHTPSQKEWEIIGLDIEHAMKNLYGKGLRRTELLQHRKTLVVEMNFAEEPDQALLNRIFQCPQYGGVDECFFAPELHIINGTAKAPTGVDICTRYLNSSPLVKKGLKCRNYGNGEYTLRCDGNDPLPPSKHGALTVVECGGNRNSAERFVSNSAALLFCIVILAVAL